METPVTTYTIKGVFRPIIWEFKYNLNGDLVSFKILDTHPLNDVQIEWLRENLPYKQNEIEDLRKHKNFELIKNEPDLSFTSFWNAYNYKVKKVMAERAWKKLSKADRINAIAKIKHYDGFLKRKFNQSKANPASYLNQRYWEDNYGSEN